MDSLFLMGAATASQTPPLENFKATLKSNALRIWFLGFCFFEIWGASKWRRPIHKELFKFYP